MSKMILFVFYMLLVLILSPQIQLKLHETICRLGAQCRWRFSVQNYVPRNHFSEAHYHAQLIHKKRISYVNKN